MNGMPWTLDGIVERKNIAMLLQLRSSFERQSGKKVDLIGSLLRIGIGLHEFSVRKGHKAFSIISYYWLDKCITPALGIQFLLDLGYMYVSLASGLSATQTFVYCTMSATRRRRRA